MPATKPVSKSISKPVFQAARHPKSRAKTHTIVAQRERLMAELAALREQGAASKFVENAQQLLTRWWSGASWSAREDLLSAADWLLRAEKRREQPIESLA